MKYWVQPPAGLYYSKLFVCFKYLFTYLALPYLSCGKRSILVAVYGVWFPNQGLNPGPLHWEHRVLAIGQPDKSLKITLIEERPQFL